MRLMLIRVDLSNKIFLQVIYLIIIYIYLLYIYIHIYSSKNKNNETRMDNEKGIIYEGT